MRASRAQAWLVPESLSRGGSSEGRRPSLSVTRRGGGLLRVQEETYPLFTQIHPPLVHQMGFAGTEFWRMERIAPTSSIQKKQHLAEGRGGGRFHKVACYLVQTERLQVQTLRAHDDQTVPTASYVSRSAWCLSMHTYSDFQGGGEIMTSTS